MEVGVEDAPEEAGTPLTGVAIGIEAAVLGVASGAVGADATWGTPPGGGVPCDIGADAVAPDLARLRSSRA